MEDKTNLVKKGTKTRAGGCPTRLQKHAPASLEIDKVLNGRPANPFGPSAEASKAIPLLSPLILSPHILFAETTIQAQTPENSGNGSISNEGRSSSSSKAIPLLSPLILSPHTLFAETTIQARTPGNSGNGSISNEGRSSSSMPTTGWEHPAMAPFSEPSSLCSFLRKQCVIVNHAP